MGRRRQRSGWTTRRPGFRGAADGKPNLAGPAPRTADRKPDLSGVWEHLNARTTAYYLDGVEIPWQAWSLKLFEQRTEDNQLENPESRCLPRGVPKADAFDLHKIVQTPGLILILYEYQNTFRQIFTDGRKLPVDSIRHGWDIRWAIGKATRLVVESNGFNGKAWLSGKAIR